MTPAPGCGTKWAGASSASVCSKGKGCPSKPKVSCKASQVSMLSGKGAHPLQLIEAMRRRMAAGVPGCELRLHGVVVGELSVLEPITEARRVAHLGGGGRGRGRESGGVVSFVRQVGGVSRAVAAVAAAAARSRSLAQVLEAVGEAALVGGYAAVALVPTNADGGLRQVGLFAELLLAVGELAGGALPAPIALEEHAKPCLLELGAET
eukprot:CAMPEP_0115230448 /NCGR_PEP_ID=MMETSP0270-20121206/32721_1 /TAXON_ID=71861 /ORGANISM="Scrippsiella trochoidea, Strain CCMP3099" /LENGTH=207 /DNA_ID=CAMNT_0002645041 /DNA_START=53 /DNA_END=672 /DNA_ORIENTATION=-